MTNFEYFKTKEKAEREFCKRFRISRISEGAYSLYFSDWLFKEHVEGYKREDDEITVYTLIVKYPGSIEEIKFRYFDEACERINEILKENKMFTLYSEIMKKSSFEDYVTRESIRRKNELSELKRHNENEN